MVLLNKEFNQLDAKSNPAENCWRSLHAMVAADFSLRRFPEDGPGPRIAADWELGIFEAVAQEREKGRLEMVNAVLYSLTKQAIVL